MAVERIDVDNTTDRLQAVLHCGRYDFALELIPEDARVLEIGTGAGGMTVQLVAKCEDYTGIEFDPEAIAMTRNKLHRDARILQGDARALPFADRSFSHIVCLEVLEHLGDWTAGLDEIHRCLDFNGAAIISVPYRKHGGRSESNPYHLYEPGEQQLIQASRARFENVDYYSQYFHERWYESLARILHVRRLVGLDRLYTAMTQGDTEAMERMRIGYPACGMKIGVILIVSGPRVSVLPTAS